MKDELGFEVVEDAPLRDELGFEVVTEDTQTNRDPLGFEVVGVDPSVPPEFGTELKAPNQGQIAAEQRRWLREKLSPFMGDTPEQAAQRLGGERRPGLLAPDIPLPIPRVPPQPTLGRQILGGAANAGAGLIEGLQQPLLMMSGAALPKAVQGVISGYFAADMASHVPEGVRQTIAAAKAGETQSAVESGLGTLGSAAFALGAGKHAVGAIPETSAAVALARSLGEQRGPVGRGLETPAPNVNAAGQRQAPGFESVDAVPPWIKSIIDETSGRQKDLDPIEVPAAEAPVRETITGLDERTGSEMPAEREERPGLAPSLLPPRQLPEPPLTVSEKSISEIKAPTEEPNTTESTPEAQKARRKLRADVDRPPDILDELESYVGKIDPAVIEQAIPGWKPKGSLRKYFSRGGVQADVALDALVRQGLQGARLDPAKVDAFATAMEDAVKQRKDWRKRFYGEERELESLSRQSSQFTKQVIQGERPKKEQANVEVVPVDNLIEGDTFEVQSQKFKVTETEFDEDGRLLAVTVKDGPKFGVQRLGPEQAEVLHIDRGTFKSPAAEDTFAPPQETPPKAAESRTTPQNAAAPMDAGFFDKPESITEQKAREAELEAQSSGRARQEEIARRRQAPLTGSQGDIGQGGLFESDPKADLFSGPSAEARSRSGAKGSAPSGYPGGPLGAGPADPINSPDFSVLPLGMQEGVEFIRQLTGGKYPKVMEKLRLLGGRALGVFRAKMGQPSIELRADIFELLTEADKRRLREEAAAFADQTAATDAERQSIYKERFEFLMEEALTEAKRRYPEIAMKVLWHEIGHLVDYLPDRMIDGRGNLFGHIAALKGWLRQSLPFDSRTPDRPVTEADRGRMYREAEAELRREMGPIEEIVRTIVTEEPIYQSLKITPEDIKNLMGMDARERLPDLYSWFAKQDSKTKAEVLRAAMKDLVDDRLASVAGTVKVGTRKVERTVREKVGRDPTKEEIKSRFQTLLEAEMGKRRMAQLAKVKAELEPLIAWWRGTDKMEAYFKTPDEMFAEAYSVFINNPAAMASRAPTTYGLFHGWMDQRPEVKALYDKMQDSMRSGTIYRERVDRLRNSWNQDATTAVQRWRDRAKIKSRDFLDNVIYHYDRRFGPVFRSAKTPKSQASVREAIGNFTYRAAEHERFLGTMNGTVGGTLLKHNLDWNDLGELLFHRRVEGERHSMANSLGWNTKDSIARLAEIQSQLGPTRFAALEQAAAEFRNIYASQVIPLMKRARLWSDELQTKIDANAVYATFAAVRGLPDNGIMRELEMSFGSSVTPHIYRQIGHLGEIKNPATATVLKSLSLITAAHRNIAKRAIVQSLLRDSPTDIAPAKKVWNGKKWEFRMEDTDKVGTIVLLQDGKPEAYYVRRVIADAINNGPASQSYLQNAAISGINWQKGLFTALNYGFWPMNFVRDTLGFWYNMPGMKAPLAWFKYLPASITAARASVRGDLKNPIADELLRRQMVVSREDPKGVTSDVANEYDIKLASFGLDPKLWDREANGVHLLAKAWHKYLAIGQVLERTQKAIGMQYLDESFQQLPEWKKQEIVRERAGSPNFLERGASNPQADFFMLFYNAFKQGIRATVKNARENPGEFASKVAIGVITPSVLMAAGSSGILGNDAKEKYASVPDYDLSNYLIFPLGWVDKANKKVAYIRFPIPDTIKVLHAGVFRALTNRGNGYMALAGGQLPGMNPILQTVGAWWDYSQGRNPIDHHYGRPILDDATATAGGHNATTEMGKWTWNALGGGILHRFQNVAADSPPSSQVEEFLKLPVVSNALGRWVKVSNRGIYDADKRNIQEQEQRRAEVQVAVRTLVRRWADTGLLAGAKDSAARFDSTNLARTIADTEMTRGERVLLREPYAMEYLARTLPEVLANRQSLLQSRLNRMPNKAAKIEVLKRESAPAR